ncbi:hypothetical protein GCM10011374_40000 [Kocuria dechangensis]|uniref:Uncharacterized protein n=1 Tax=Kocuria dechangensis TaxID=1176249 RepID=A0A917H9N7_9MICC|nr:hypothetical protein GCM10011374_40000 [Kocuria dechangensis]
MSGPEVRLLGEAPLGVVRDGRQRRNTSGQPAQHRRRLGPVGPWHDRPGLEVP